LTPVKIAGDHRAHYGSMKKLLLSTAIAPLLLAASPARADAPQDSAGAPQGAATDWAIKPTLDARLRTELVRQGGLEANSVTLRLRPGVQVAAPGGFTFLAEAEGTVALDKGYNAFPFASTSSEARPQYAVVADPQTAELNRLQVQYKAPDLTITLGRQRIVLDDARLVGNAGWRDNEQTFDAARIEAKTGPINLDAAMAISQRTIFGSAAGTRTAYDGKLVFLGASAPVGPVRLKGFAYLLDYAAREQAGFQAVPLADAATLGLRAAATFKPAPAARIDLAATWARQSAFADNPASYSVDYLFAEGCVNVGPITLTIGDERLGSDGLHAFQRPAANQPRFDQYVVTPAQGLNDAYAGIAWRIGGLPVVKNVTASITAHDFAATAVGQDYGTGLEAALIFKAGPAMVLLKAADFSAAPGGTSWTKFWIQADFSL
jgi:hypothetical protein